MLTNLLEETTEALERHGLKPSDVVRVINGVASCSWEEFSSLASNINYDAGFGGNKIELNLKVAGADWWLERSEYDGSEWWRLCRHPGFYGVHKLTVGDIMEDWED